jgi:hypothetical protein
VSYALLCARGDKIFTLIFFFDIRNHGIYFINKNFHLQKEEAAEVPEGEAAPAEAAPPAEGAPAEGGEAPAEGAPAEAAPAEGAEGGNDNSQTHKYRYLHRTEFCGYQNAK